MFIVLEIFIVYLTIKRCSKNIKENIYEYKNIAYIGSIIFLSFTILIQIISVVHYDGLIQEICVATDAVSSFSNILLPIAFIVSILVTISHIQLMKKEGKTIKNMLGLILGIFFCVATIFPSILSDILQNSKVIDVHSESGIAMYVEVFIDLTIYTIVSYFECLLIGTLILGIKAAKYIPKLDKDYILILGCKLKEDGTLTNLLKSRVDRAIEFCKIQEDKIGKKCIFVPSGGKGNDEIISEAEAMKNYLLEQGIEENRILIEDKSTNTYENIKFSNKIIKDQNCNANVAFSTTNYHVYRAGNIADEQGIKMEGIGAKTKSYFWINAFIREYIAIIVYYKKQNLIILGILILLQISVTILRYFSNIL